MGTNLTDKEQDEMPGWVGRCFSKLRARADGANSKPTSLTQDEARYLLAVLGNTEHLAHYGEGYAQHVCRRTIEMGKRQDFNINLLGDD